MSDTPAIAGFRVVSQDAWEAGLAACEEYRSKLDKLERELTVANNWVEHHQNHCDDLIKENAALREWVKEEGKRNDVCTYGILKEVCEDCRCGKRKEAQP